MLAATRVAERHERVPAQPARLIARHVEAVERGDQVGAVEPQPLSVPGGEGRQLLDISDEALDGSVEDALGSVDDLLLEELYSSRRFAFRPLEPRDGPAGA